jgi:PAS domain S-box-containing protein
MSDKKLLIIDDSPDIHDFVAAMLAGEPAECVYCACGEDGLAAARELHPDLILLDVELPGLDGFEVCRRLKSAVETADIPVVLITGANSTGEKLRGLELGATDYVTKPFDPAELRALVRSLLNTSRLMGPPAQRAIQTQQLNNQLAFQARYQPMTRFPNALFSDRPALDLECTVQKVLIVDDSPDIHDLITASLCREPIEFYSLMDGTACLSETLRLMPDLVLLDVDMPVVDGFEVCRSLKADAATAAIPIVFLTGAGLTSQKLEGLALGAVDYVTKPFDSAELGARVKSALNAKRLLDQLAERNQTLADSEHRFRTLVDQAADSMFLCDSTGRFVDVNRQACESLGYTREQLMAMSVSDIETGIDHEEQAQIRARAAREAVTIDGIHRRRDGTAFPVEIRIGVVHAGPQPLLLALARDVSERRRAEQLLRQRAHLRDAVAAMEHVLGVVSHELRTPLASVGIMCEVLQQHGPALPAELADFLSQISSEIVRMSETVDVLLEAARLNTGTAVWNWERFLLHSVAESAMESIRPGVDASRIDLELSVSPGAAMSGDEQAVRRLLINLLTNCVRHTTGGSIRVAIRSDVAGDSAFVEIEVRDTGCGIDPRVRERLGEAFALNAGAVGVSHVSGRGLGLVICKAIIAAHGGTLAIDSTVGLGTTVTVRLRADLSGACSTGCDLLEGVASRAA